MISNFKSGIRILEGGTFGAQIFGSYICPLVFNHHNSAIYNWCAVAHWCATRIWSTTLKTVDKFFQVLGQLSVVRNCMSVPNLPPAEEEGWTICSSCPRTVEFHGDIPKVEDCQGWCALRRKILKIATGRTTSDQNQSSDPSSLEQKLGTKFGLRVQRGGGKDT